PRTPLCLLRTDTASVCATTRPPPRHPLFPYTTLFRSRRGRAPDRGRSDRHGAVQCGGAARGRRPRTSLAFAQRPHVVQRAGEPADRKSTRLNSSHSQISYAVFCLKKKIQTNDTRTEYE